MIVQTASGYEFKGRIIVESLFDYILKLENFLGHSKHLALEFEELKFYFPMNFSGIANPVILNKFSLSVNVMSIPYDN